MKACVKCGSPFNGKECNVCKKARKASYSAANKEKIQLAGIAYRAANREKVKLAKLKWASENPEWVKAAQLKHYAANKQKIIARSAEWKIKNPDNVSVSNAKHREANRDKARVATAKWASENRDKVRANTARWAAENKERKNATNAAWKAANGDALKIYVQNRRARKLANGGILSKGLEQKLYKLQRGKCPCCKQPLGDDYHLDHIIPLALGGTNTDDNMQLLRSICNMQKHAKHPIEFMQSRGYLL